MSSRRRRNRAEGKGKGVANPERTKVDSTYVSRLPVPAPPRDYDSDGPDENPAYTEAVGMVLERLEGAWYESEYFHQDAAERTLWERQVNDYIAAIKLKVQELL